MKEKNGSKCEMFFNMNEFVRDKISLLDFEANKNGYFNEESIVIISIFLKDCNKIKNKVNKNFIENVMTCMYADTYKMLNFKKKNNIHNYNDSFLLNQLINVTDKNEVIEGINNPDILFELLRNELEFIKTNELGKINIFKHLNEEDHRNIVRINKSHKEDIKLYDDYIDTDRYLKYYQATIKTDINDETDPIEDIENFMKKLYYIDRKNFNDNYKDMLRTYYKWTKFMSYNNPKISEISSKLRIISLIEKNSMDDLEDVAAKNKDFLYTIIDEYLYRSINPFEIIKRDGIVETISDEKVDSFIIKNTNKSTLNKLGFSFKSKLK